MAQQLAGLTAPAAFLRMCWQLHCAALCGSPCHRCAALCCPVAQFAPAGSSLPPCQLSAGYPRTSITHPTAPNLSPSHRYFLSAPRAGAEGGGAAGGRFSGHLAGVPGHEHAGLGAGMLLGLLGDRQVGVRAGCEWVGGWVGG